MQTPYKFGKPDNIGVDQPWLYPNVWKSEATSDGNRRLAIAPSSDQVEMLIRLLRRMPGPFGILYVLVVPRGETRPGRYQCSEPQTLNSVERFLREFGDFIETDGRHHIWITSTSGPGLLVYDRHNIIYAYGPADEWRSLLAEEGLNEDSALRVPSPHSHHYHQSLDSEEIRLMNQYEWKFTALTQQDEE